MVAEARSGGDGDGRATVQDAETLRLQRSSPVVRRLAAEHDVDISEISGTGTGGRVTKKDIESFIEEREAAPAAAARPGARPERVQIHDGDQVLELTSIRRAIANRMAASKAQIPHAWTDRKSTRLNSSHANISYAVFCLK